MLNIETYIGEKEYEFLDNYRGMLFDEVLEEVEVSAPSSINELSNFHQLLNDKFIKELFNDAKFLEVEVISHYYKEDGKHVFGLKNYGGWKLCGNIITRQFAVIIDTNTKAVSFKSCICYEWECVEDSSYVEKSLYKVKKLLRSCGIEVD